MIGTVEIKRFTVFEELTVNCSPGINIFVGANGTGKTHFLKILYTVISALKENKRISEKIVDVFLPKEKLIGRLVKRKKGSSKASIRIEKQWGRRKDTSSIFSLSFSNHTKETLRLYNGWKNGVKGTAIFIPVKEMLANAPNFLALYEKYNLHFESVYADIIHYANLPALRGPIEKNRKKLLQIIQNSIDGRVIQKEETFYLKNSQGELEFTLLAEGMRKLGLLWLLIQNGTLTDGSYLFWDEPEANLNPKIMRTVVTILLELHRIGIQIFLSTHDYVLLKEFDLQMGKNDRIAFHSLYKDEKNGEISVQSTDRYLDIHPNTIAETFANLFDREIEKSLGGLGK